MLLFPLFVNTSNITTILVVAYSVLSLTLGLVATQMYSRMTTKLSELPSVGTTTFLYYLVQFMAPVFLILGLLLYSLYLFIRYRNIINDGFTSDQYYTFSKVSTAFMIIHFIILFNGFSTKEFAEKSMMPAVYNSGIYLTGIINAYLIIIMGYILSSYTTDG